MKEKLEQQERVRKEWVEKDAARDKQDKAFRDELERRRKQDILNYKKSVEEKRILASKKPIFNISSVLLKDIPKQNILLPKTVLDELKRRGSPIANPKLANLIIEESIKHGIDPSFVLAQMIAESNAGKSGRANKNKNPGNLRDMSKRVKTDEKAFIIYSSWEKGIKAMISRLSSKGYVGGGLTNVSKIAYKYAPPVENKTNDYIRLIQDIRNNLFKKNIKNFS